MATGHRRLPACDLWGFYWSMSQERSPVNAFSGLRNHDSGAVMPARWPLRKLWRRSCCGTRGRRRDIDKQAQGGLIRAEAQRDQAREETRHDLEAARRSASQAGNVARQQADLALEAAQREAESNLEETQQRREVQQSEAGLVADRQEFLSSLGYAGVQRRRRTPVEQQGIDELCDQLFQSESDELCRLDEAFARLEADAPGPDLMALGTAPRTETAPRMNTRSSAFATQGTVVQGNGRRIQPVGESQWPAWRAAQTAPRATPRDCSAANNPPRRTALGRIWLAATLARVGFCVFIGLRDFGRITLPIEQIQVMQNRVLADNPEINGPAPGQFGPIDPPNWRLVDLRMQKPDGGWLDITLGRPAWWLEEVAARPGASVHLDLEGLDVVGEARVLAVRPSPTPKAGDGRVVTGRFVHNARNVLEASIEGRDEPLRVTANHLFWSADCEEFVHAVDLLDGETLRSHDGQTLHVIALTPLRGVHRVYNVEVDGGQVYCVGSAGVLVHNMCAAPNRVVPHGFITPDEFGHFRSAISRKMRGAGYDVQAVLQGRGVTGVRVR